MNPSNLIRTRPMNLTRMLIIMKSLVEAFFYGYYYYLLFNNNVILNAETLLSTTEWKFQDGTRPNLQSTLLLLIIAEQSPPYYLQRCD